jgi:AcrR family transcriptional regulator
VTTLRADAQRNLGRVLDAAAEVFAERGPGASVDEIALRAGVGHATVFRRFPTKDALIAAVVEKRIAELNTLVDDALDRDDARIAFTEFVWRAAELAAKDRRLDECFLRCSDSPTLRALRDAGARITSRAQEEGAVRSDIPPHEVGELIRAAIRVAGPGDWRRNVQIVLDGLQPRR